MTSQISACPDSTTIVVNVSATPEVSISGELDVCIVCIDEETTYSTSSSSDYSNQWIVEGGTILGPDNKYQVDVLWDNTGEGKIKLN